MQQKSYCTLPFFWSDVLGKKIRFVGSIDSFDQSITEGDVDDMKFVTYYVNDNDEITGVLAVDREGIASVCNELMRQQQMPSASEVLMGMANSESMINKLNKINAEHSQKALKV